MKKYFKIALIILVCFLLLAGSILFYLSRGLNEGQDITINEVNLSNLEDGLYIGLYERAFIFNRQEL